MLFVSFFVVAHGMVAVTGMVFNLFLVYLAIFHTPRVIKSYTTLIINFAMTDFFACLADLVVQQRIIPAGWTLGYISNGLCKYHSPTACYVGYSLMLHFFSHSLWSLLLSFSYRYYILFHSAPTRLKLFGVVLLIYIPSLFQLISFLWAQDEPSEIVEILHNKFPDYTLDGYTVTGTKNILCFSALFTILHMTLPVTPVYTGILIFRKKIIQQLAEKTANLTKTTKKLHSQLLMALTFQAMLPGFYAISVGSYGIGQLGIYNHPVLEYTTFTSVIFIPLLSPVASFVFVTPYRRFITRFFIRGKIVDPTYETSYNHSLTTRY
ncbi:unnamed protein product [Caenorhabditis angaria]|uniref:G-protein coupled receptors family 1 profile domain-containing protein n=1 Tax=Caenorhabditis angaria TaxID=860376 RepID=A0A9P1IM18_9PELO|nr:unnamed protein product [Caenorhabditis angaria]